MMVLSADSKVRWAKAAGLAEERWPGLDARGVKSWAELVQRLQRDLGYTEGRARDELDVFARSLPGDVGTDDEWD